MTKMTNVSAINYVLDNFGADMPEDVLAKMTTLRDTYAKKSASRKPTKVQEANVRFKEAIKDFLSTADKPMTVTEIVVAIPEFEGNVTTTPKVSALLKQMKDTGEVVRTEDKKRAFFALA